MADREATRQKLVEVAIELIERLGLAHVTVRALADAAGVNVAAVNYYFGSKEALIEAALAQTLQHTLGDLHAILPRLDGDPRGATAELLGYLAEGARSYPNVTRAHVHGMFAAGAASAPLGEGLAPVVAKLADAITKATGLPRSRATHRAVQGVSAVLFPSFFPGFFPVAAGLQSPRARAAYVEEVVAGLFAPPR